jgi:hypothetical protein
VSRQKELKRTGGDGLQLLNQSSGRGAPAVDDHVAGSGATDQGVGGREKEEWE